MFFSVGELMQLLLPTWPQQQFHYYQELYEGREDLIVEGNIIDKLNINYHR